MSDTKSEPSERDGEGVTTEKSIDVERVYTAEDPREGAVKVGPQKLARSLQSRHIQMIAIGSNIGTGLFVGSGKSLHTGGPLSLIMGFFLISIAIAIMMQSLAEMGVVLPISGSFAQYASRMYGRDLGFAIGWQYWLAWVAVFGAEASAFVILIQYWDTNTDLVPLWITIFILVNFAIHFFPVRVFGEVEFFISALKVTAVVVFLIVTWIIMGGGGPHGHRHGGEYWKLPGLENGVANGFQGFASVFVTAGFAGGGFEMVGIAAGESAHPLYNLPRASRTLTFRVFIFYVMTMLFLSFVVKYSDERLVGGSDAGSSPFVIAISDAGIRVLPDILNAIIMICTISVGSTSIYICSRVLKGLAHDGLAFAIFKRTDKHGRPWVALVFTGVIGIVLAYLNCSSTGAVVFGWFSAISGVAFFLTWAVIIACQWRFRHAIEVQGDDALKSRYAFHAAGYPWLSVLGFVMILFMIICQFIVSVWPIDKSPSASYFFSQFIGAPIFLVMWAGYRIVYRNPWHKAKDIDLQTGRRVENPEEIAMIEHYRSLSRWKRFCTYLRF